MADDGEGTDGDVGGQGDVGGGTTCGAGSTSLGGGGAGTAETRGGATWLTCAVW